MKLIWQANDGTEPINMTIPDVDIPTATLAILPAIAELKPPKKPRSDKGTTRKDATTQP